MHPKYSVVFLIPIWSLFLSCQKGQTNSEAAGTQGNSSSSPNGKIQLEIRDTTDEKQPIITVVGVPAQCHDLPSQNIQAYFNLVREKIQKSCGSGGCKGSMSKTKQCFGLGAAFIAKNQMSACSNAINSKISASTLPPTGSSVYPSQPSQNEPESQLNLTGAQSSEACDPNALTPSSVNGNTSVQNCQVSSTSSIEMSAVISFKTESTEVSQQSGDIDTYMLSTGLWQATWAMARGFALDCNLANPNKKISSTDVLKSLDSQEKSLCSAAARNAIANAQLAGVINATNPNGTELANTLNSLCSPSANTVSKPQ